MLILQIYSSHEWDKLMLNYVVPQLGASLRNDFVINPRKQDMAPHQNGSCHGTRSTVVVFTQLLEVNFFRSGLTPFMSGSRTQATVLTR